MRVPIYLDNNATTRIAPEVLEAMLPYLTEAYGNPSSHHLFGEPVRSRIEEARSATAALLGAKPAEIVFTSGGTESNHLAILGALALRKERRQIVTTPVEHSSIGLLFRDLEEKDYRVDSIPVDRDGNLDTVLFERTVTNKTALVSVMWANNETGTRFPIERLAGIVRGKGVLFHTDAVQAVGKVPVSVSNAPVDFLSFSGHKLHAPKGVGALFVRKGIELPPLFFGHQERRRRGGTENVPAIIGLGEACRIAVSEMPKAMERVGALRERLEDGILRVVPEARINGNRQNRVPNTSNIRFGTADSEAVLNRLNRAGIAASAGSACASGGTEPSHVLMAMGMSREEALASIRFSLSRYTRPEEVNRVIDVIPAILQELRNVPVVRSSVSVGAGSAIYL